MFLQPTLFNDTLIFCDMASKYNFKNIYQNQKFNSIQIQYSANMFKKTQKKIVKQSFLHVVLYALVYYVSGNSPSVEYSKKKKIKSI